MFTILRRSFLKIPKLKRPVRYLEKNGCDPQDTQKFKIVLNSSDEIDWCEDPFDANRRKGRPLSPCLSIYRPQITSMLSIAHRMTGVVLSGYVSLFGLSAYFCKNVMTTSAEMIEELGISSSVLCLCKFIIAYPFVYHACAGIRHIIWDFGRFLTIPGVHKTGYVVLLASVAGSVILCAL